MRYRVLIRKCDDPQRAARIAEEVARWSGSSAQLVSAAIMSKTICVRYDADEGEAARLKAQFEAVGGQVDLQEVAAGAEAAAGAPMAGKPSRRKDDDDDDADDKPRRVLSEAEYVAKLGKRVDIFTTEKDNRVRNVEIVSVLLCIGISVYLSSVEVVEVPADFYAKMPEERVAKLVTNMPETLQKEEEKKKKEEEKKKLEEFKTEKKTMSKKKPGAGGTTGGGGDPRARVTRKGVLGIITGQVKGKSVASADVFGKGGFASGIDGILAGVGGLKSGGSGGVGRKGVAGIGYGAGYGSGFGGGAGGVDDLLGNLMGGGDEGGTLALKKKGSLKLTEPEFTKGGALTGGRSKASIMRVVMQNLGALRYAYSQRLREKPGLKGKITVKFAIDEFGKVIFCKVIDSSMDDAALEGIVSEKVRRWVFDKIDKPGDITEVVYPFVFSQ